MTEQTPEPVYEPPRFPRRDVHRTGWRTARRVVGIALLSLLGLVVLAIVAALVWLHTGSGAVTVGRIVTDKARNAIQGDLRVQRVEVSGFLHVCVDGVQLRDPDGNTALTAERACVSLSPLALRSRRIQVGDLELTKPWVELAKAPGTDETTLARAIAPRVKSQPGGKFDWTVNVDRLELRGGALTVRPEVGEPATFALQDLDVTQAHALYAVDAAAAALKLRAQLAAPGKAPIALDLDASVKGPLAKGTAAVRTVALRLGESRLSLNGSWDLARQSGALALRDLVLTPQDVAAIVPSAPLSGPVRGEADLKSDGRVAQLSLNIRGGGGEVKGTGTLTLEKVAEWDLQLSVSHLDPGAIAAKAPNGTVDARVALHGKGKPRFDVHGVRGDLGGTIHIGPAKLDRVGPVVADLDAKLYGRYAIVKAFSATALGLTVKAHGAAAYDEISLDLDLNAPDLSHVGKAVGALTRKPSLPLSGATRLTARVTGSPMKPDAEVHLRAPRLRFEPTVDAEGLAVDGVLHGPLRNPDGSLQVKARALSAGSIDLGAPRIAMDLRWPVAHLGIDAGVEEGALQLAGDATINEDRDGLVLSGFAIRYPGNELHLARPTNVRFRNQIIVEPLNLVGDHGSLRFSAEIEPPPGRIDAAVVVTKFELDHLPQFALPKDLGLRGVLDGNAVVQGPRAAPDLDLQADLRGVRANRIGDLALDARAHAHIHGGRLRTDGWVASTGILRFEWKGEAPIERLKTQPASAPLQLAANLQQVDLTKLAQVAKLTTFEQHKVHGLVSARVAASGTLGAPRATVSLDVANVGTDKVKDVDGKLGLLLEKGRAVLDGTVVVGGAPALAVTAQAPFDLQRALRERTYLRDARERPIKAEVAVIHLPLERLASAGLLPENSAGAVNLTARVSGTLAKPQLQLFTAGENVTVARIHGLAFQGQLDIADKVKLSAGAQAQGHVVARLDAGATLSGAELLELMARRREPAAIAPLLDRTVSLNLDVPGLPIARASQLAGRTAIAEGTISGRVSLMGTPARPHLTGQLAVKDVSARDKRLGTADVYVEADGNGALLHLGIDPPGGGNFLGHAQLQADLGARALLRSGLSGIRQGALTGRVQANHLDLAFLSGLFPRLRRTGGTLDGDVTLAGDVSRPIAQGAAHLRRGVVDIVGQGVYEDVGLDATFSPKEVVIDRITGTTGTGTFAAILVASRRPAPQAATGEHIEFTGEVHLGDDESVKGRTLPDGKPLAKAPVPLRQAGEQRADVSGELDIFGDYTDNLLTVNARIPDARIVIRQLPDKKLPGLKENPDVFLVHPGERPHPVGREPEEMDAEAKARREATFRMHAHLDLLHLYVKAPDFEFPVESAMNFDYDARHPDTPTADGTIHVPQGSFTALGRRFTIEDARITETGGEITDPELEVKALFENPQATVTITVSGTAKDPQLEMSSNPPMDQDAIAFFLATGRIQGRATQSGGGVDLSGAATSVLGGLLFGQVRKELANVLPVDVLTIETGAQGVSEASIGKYIGDRIYIGYRQRLVPTTTENTEEGRIEYEISRALSAEATVGDRNSDLSVLWTKDF